MNGVVVRFETGGRKLRAVPGPGVLGVIENTPEALAVFEVENQKKEPKVRIVRQPKPPREVKIMHATRNEEVYLGPNEHGPRSVCYYVRGKVVCYGPEEER